MRTELRHIIRELLRNPGFTTVAVLTLALGGANTAIFTLIHQAMLRQLPVAQPEQLWRIGENVRCCYSTGYAQNNWSFFSWDAYKTFRANTQAFEDLAAFQAGNALLGLRREGSSGAVTTANGQYVSGNFFKTLGVSAWRGRFFTDSDDRPGALPVAVLSYHSWQQKYGLDPSVVGAAYQIRRSRTTRLASRIPVRPGCF